MRSSLIVPAPRMEVAALRTTRFFISMFRMTIGLSTWVNIVDSPRSWHFADSDLGFGAVTRRRNGVAAPAAIGFEVYSPLMRFRCQPRKRRLERGPTEFPGRVVAARHS